MQGPGGEGRSLSGVEPVEDEPTQDDAADRPGGGAPPPPAPPGDQTEAEPAEGWTDKALHKADLLRKALGIVCGLASLGIVFWVVTDTFEDLRRTTRVHNEYELTLALMRLGGHAVVAVAVVFFAYQLLRVGERLGVPSRLLRSENVDVVRAILGVRVPTAELVKTVRELKEAIEQIARR